MIVDFEFSLIIGSNSHILEIKQTSSTAIYEITQSKFQV